MDPRPVGVFDSGTGGLTVLHECLVTMPHEDFIYLGDLARLPYGPRPLEEIRRYALFGAQASGQYDRFKAFVDSCMAEYDLDGWTAKDLITPR
jgi:glutamate racemase